MECNDFEMKIPEFLDGAIDTADRRKMELHRESCPSCARMFALHEQILLALDSAEPVKAPAGLAERILAAVAEEEAVARPALVPKWASTLIAASLIFVTGAILRLGSFISQTTGLGDTIADASGSWSVLFAWPLLVKAWFLGLLAHPWLQMITNSVYFRAFDLNVPIYFFVAYIAMLGVLGLYTIRFFQTPVTVRRHANSLR